MLEQTRENDKKIQTVHDSLVDNSRALSEILETLMEQVGGCQAEIQGFTSNAKKAQRKLEQMKCNLHHKKDHPHHNQEAEHEIPNEMDEARKRFDEDLEAM